MKTIKASAPAKAVISGEYAVLSDAPAVSMALNRRAIVTIVPGKDRCHSVCAPGFAEGEFRFEVSPAGRLVWLDALPDPQTFALFEAVWRRVAPPVRSPLRLELDTRSFLEPASGLKLGIGSSAALAVALVAAFAELPFAHAAKLDTALDAHRAFQSGKGSGVDVATAWHGGLLIFRRNAQARSVCLPAGVHYQFLWSGRSASTADRIGGIADREESAAAAALTDAATAVERSLTACDGTGQFLSELSGFVDALVNYDEENVRGIFDAGHDALLGRARSQGDVVYKPCGAGGGDIGVAMAAFPDALDQFCDEAKAEGFSLLDAHLETDGVLVEAK